MHILLGIDMPRSLNDSLKGHVVWSLQDPTYDWFARLSPEDFVYEAAKNGYDVIVTNDLKVRKASQNANRPVATVMPYYGANDLASFQQRIHKLAVKKEDFHLVSGVNHKLSDGPHISDRKKLSYR